MIQLSMEQEFRINCFKQKIEELDTEQLKKLLVEYYTLAITADTYYKKAIAERWGIATETSGHTSGDTPGETIAETFD